MSKDFGQLVQDLISRSLEVRRAAAKSLGKRGDARAVEPLIAILRDESIEVRTAAVEALGKIGDTRAVGPLIDALGDEHRNVRGTAVWALGKLGDTRALESLIAALKDEDRDVRRAAAWALGELGDARAFDSLIGILEDEDWQVRETVTRALKKYRPSIARGVAGKTILIIDDSAEIRNFLRENVLEPAGYMVLEAPDGQSGLMRALAGRPDLILLDLNMPRLTGLEVLEELQKATANIPVILMTFYGSEGVAVQAFRLGIKDYISKPFEIDEVLQAIRSVLLGTQTQVEFLLQEIKRLHRQRQELYHRIEMLNRQERLTEMKTMPFSELEPLVSGIVHDLRGGLGVISNTTSFLLDYINENDSLATDLRKIAYSTEFCEVVVRNLMALVGGVLFEPAEVNIEEVVREVFFMLERKLVDVELVVDADADTPTIVADEGQMKQVFMNLIKNAGEAMPDGGTLTVCTRREGQTLHIEVGDTGCGISPESQARLFREFFTTKAHGYGLGLHIVNTIVERHGGTIEVQSQLGKGTTFILHLPVE